MLNSIYKLLKAGEVLASYDLVLIVILFPSQVHQIKATVEHQNFVRFYLFHGYDDTILAGKDFFSGILPTLDAEIVEVV